MWGTMNIVKGVADLLRRSTSERFQGESTSGRPQGDKFAAPAPHVRFSEVGDEPVLHSLWERYEKAIDKVEKRKLFHVFLKQFLTVYKNWEPANSGLLETATTSVQPAEHSNDIVIGCSAGHPADVILILTEEIIQLTARVSELNTNMVQSTADLSGASTSLSITSEGLPVLDALTVITRSMHNCKVFAYYGGTHKLTALMKGVVVQLKTIAGALSSDESNSNTTVEMIGLMQQILVYVVSIIHNFIELNTNVLESAQLYNNTIELSVPMAASSPVDSSSSLKSQICQARLQWHQKAVMSVMEAGGLNWLVELLRVIRRLCMKEVHMDIRLLYLTLRTLHLALYDNSRGQSHFKSIGGLEVLLDGFGLASNNALTWEDSCSAYRNRDEHPLVKTFKLHVLSLEVLREAVFGNVNNLQFLCENGRVHKFANSFCSLAFTFQEYNQQKKDLSCRDDSQMPVFDSENKNQETFKADASAQSVACSSASQLWNDYVVKLSGVLCSFLLPLDVKTSHHSQQSAGRAALPVSSVYIELSLKWLTRVLGIVFPCIKACSNDNQLPSHSRLFFNSLQHSSLNAFRMILASQAAMVEVFREEGMWNLIFSEDFFYFGGSSSEEFTEGSCIYNDESLAKHDGITNSANIGELKTLQMEILSFVEFAATLDGSVHNLPELSVLLNSLEKSSCDPGIASVLANRLLKIMELSSEKSIASLKTLDAVPRILKVVCIQAQESKSGRASSSFALGSNSSQTVQSWLNCMETLMSLFSQFLAIVDDARSLVLHNPTCMDCLFELFWEEGLRNSILQHILGLMKIAPTSEEDRKAKLQLCSKYLEMFTQIKEREKSFTVLSIDLLGGMRDIVAADPVYYQALFRDGECFLHVVSLLNGNLDVAKGEELVLNVLQTITCLLASNDASKAAFRTLAGHGYQTLHNLLLDFCQCHPSEELLNALLDMLVDGKFDIKASPIIQNEDVIILYLSVLQKSSDLMRDSGLKMFQQLLRDSLSNRASCVRAGMLSILLEWFSHEDNDTVILKIAQLIQVIGGHSISGKDIRKIFALLRSEKVGTQQQYCSLLLSSVLSMLNEKGPTAFFDLNGSDSGILIKTPVQWPLYKGFSFSCWLRVENFPRNGTMGLFSFLSDNGRGCLAVLSQDRLIFESINLKRQCVKLNVNLDTKKWHFLCITHTIGRAFSGGSLLKCYIDGELVSSERCRYAKVNELLTKCTIGTRSSLSLHEEDNILNSTKESIPFFGQIGPVYLFNDTLSSEQVLGIHSLGPSYMYSFLDNEIAPFHDNSLLSGILDVKEGLASKIVFGLNAQASDGRRLSNVSPVLDLSLDKNSFEATVMIGTQLCSRRLLQHIIYCVGGVSVFFPLITQSDRYEIEGSGHFEHVLLIPITKERLTAEVIELIASVLDENLANQQQMHLLSGFKILGFLLQSVPPPQLNLETLSALKHLFNVVANCGLAEVLVKDAISSIFLNPLIWLYTVYKVQRELYMFLIEQFDNDPRLLKSLCRLPRVLDIIRQFYWDNAKSRFAIGSKPLLHPITKQVIGERPTKEEIRKIRLLFLSLGEMSLRENIMAADINALIAFFETSQDMTCIEDVLHMVIRAVSQKQLLASFLEQVNLIGGPVIFINLLQRECEHIRLLSLQFIGRLLVGVPSEKKGTKFFNIAVARSKMLMENPRKSTTMQPIFAAISDRLFSYPQTDNLCATLFDVLLGGASPKQILQKHSQLDQQRSKGNGTHFLLPQILVLILRFLTGCEDASARMKIIGDLLDLLDSNASNFEAFLEYGWSAWLAASVKLDVLKDYKVKSQECIGSKLNEQNLARNLFCLMLCHCMHSVKGGWQQLEETVNFLLLQSKQGCISYRYLLRDIYEDLIRMLLDLYYEENIFVSQPCRDNTLYLLKLVDEMLISEIDYKLPFPSSSSEFSLDSLELESNKDYSSALYESFQGEPTDQESRDQLGDNQPTANDDDIANDKWWYLYDNIWIIIGVMNGKGPSKILPKSSTSGFPSLGQRARGLVESLNIPAVEMAAVVASAGGIGNALGAKPNKNIDKAMLLRGERCPRIVFRLLILYLCKASLERASRCVQQVISLLPCLLAADDEQSKSRLQLFIRALITVRSKYGMSDDGARFHVISHVLRETVNCGKSILATSIVGINDSDAGSNFKETGSIQNLIQIDRVLAAVADEARYIRNSVIDRTKLLHELYDRIDESYAAESSDRQTFEDEIQNTLNSILASDDNRRDSFQLTHEEEQQNVSEKWLHMFRTLIDERGPWSANPFPNSAVMHWKLDKTEDSWRRRPKLRQNYQFDEKLCHPPSTAPSLEAPPNVNESKSSFASHIPERMKQFLLKGVRKITDEGSSELGENDTELSEEKVSLPEDSSERQSLELVKDNNDQSDIVQDKKDLSSTSLEQESSEVLLSVPCVLVIPKRKLAGHLAIKKNVLHFFGEFLVEGTGGSSVFNDFHASSNSEASKNDQKHNFPKWPEFGLDSEKGIIHNIEAVDSMHQKKLKNIKRHRRWSIGKVRAVHWTRYLLRFTAIEIFFSGSTAPVFLNFATQKDAKQVGTLIVSTRNEFLHPKGSGRDKTGAISFIDRRVALEMAETARESWRRRDMSNFEYLMILNTLAGRSYNDLTQYPVFPWILADYTSEVLDFNKSSTFRDLSKPVGALDEKRFEVFEDRYLNFSDPDIPSFYYGSHYSSMGIVLYYLLRLEPFTTLHRGLQGGKFDHADRLFQSVEATYRNCLSNTSDVKELIPEFYYMPEFIANSNSYHLGVKQDGSPLSDVILPPWAKGSAEEFIYRNREALESEYVSSNLHHWIDLIFGYKQRGKPALEAANIFYYLTYEGAVDLETMEDDLQRLAIEDQIANFGQTPIQIFRKKHPRRGPPIPIAHPLRFAPGSINLTSIVCCTSGPVSTVVYVDVLDSNIVLVNQGLSLSVKMWLTTQLYGGNYTFSASQDPYFGVGSDILSPRKIGSPLAENVELGTQCFATMQMPFENFLISCGNWENSFQVISLTDGRVVQSIRHHKDVVSCVAVTSDGSILATGSYDTTVMVWEVLRTKGSEKRVRNIQMEAPRKDTVIIESPFHILCGHDDIITCLYISVELDIVISGSKDGTCVFHTLQEGRYVRSLRHPSGCALSKLVASRHGRIVLYSDDDLSLHLYSINGKHLATSESNGRLNCVELSKCGEFLVCAGDQGQITVRSMNSLGVVRRYSGIGKTITSLKVTAEECFLAGTKDGNLLVYSIENSQHRKTGGPRSVKSKASATG